VLGKAFFVRPSPVIGNHNLFSTNAHIAHDSLLGNHIIMSGFAGKTRIINKVGLERRGFSEEAREAIKHAYKILFREELSIPNALAKIETEVPCCRKSNTSWTSSAKANAASVSQKSGASYFGIRLSAYACSTTKRPAL